MRNAIQAFVEQDVLVCDEAANKRRDELHDDAVLLLEFFDYYVEHGAHIRLC
jgi:hypothetical protein